MSAIDSYFDGHLVGMTNMGVYSVAEAKNRLPRLIDKALEGEEVVITRRGKPVIELKPATAKSERQLERIREMDEWLAARTRSRPGVGMTSVELLNLMYDSDED
jgi:prevent-host-death family protein